ncbi:hypothetical protein AX17_002928 [Amanita inopinata Kibby_2008]|nr:hypothetical protein AX17_002928 [Amanita inopinata Kibby_2008]
MYSPTLQARTITYDSVQEGSRQPLKVVAKCYTDKDSGPDSDGLTLVLAHATGTHKEHWEPMLERLFELHRSKDGAHRIRAAWAIDCQNHGDSALLNEAVIKERPDGISIREYAAALITLIQSDELRGHRIVAVGHSSGTSAWMYTTKLLNGDKMEKLPYLSIILVEPPMIDRHVFHANIKDRERQVGFITKAIAAQRSSWDNREAALDWLLKRKPWSSWDKRILEIYSVWASLSSTVESARTNVDDL